MPPHGITNDEDKEQEQPQDYATPFSAPDGTKDSSGDTHPQSDTNVDAMEQYDEGIDGAMEVDDKGDRGIEGYDPDKKSS